MTNYPEQRIVIGGGVHTGKTRFANSLRRDARHTDDLIDTHEWSAASAEVAEWMLAPGPWVIEGVATARALRKALELTDGAPCDLLVWLTHPWVPVTPQQTAMSKGCQTVLDKIIGELQARGVTVEYQVRDSDAQDGL